MLRFRKLDLQFLYFLQLLCILSKILYAFYNFCCKFFHYFFYCYILFQNLLRKVQEVYPRPALFVCHQASFLSNFLQCILLYILVCKNTVFFTFPFFLSNSSPFNSFFKSSISLIDCSKICPKIFSFSSESKSYSDIFSFLQNFIIHIKTL